MSEQNQSEFRYFAFISYKREDEKWAKWLFNELESFVIPASICKTKAIKNRSIRPIFIDVNDLAGGSLSNEVIVNALLKSKYLILICSKATLNSAWINQELRVFLEYHGEEFIIPIFIEDNIESDNRILSKCIGINAAELGKSKTLITLVVSRIIDIDYNVLRKAKANIIHSINNYIKDYFNKIVNRSINENLDKYMPQKNDTNIFISYRRIDGRDPARTIEQALLSKNYNSIFFDFDSIQDGKFNVQILDAIYSCSDFILILSPKSMNRCSKKGDWVAREIRTAIKYNKHIIPIVIVDSNENSFQYWPRNFPKDLDEIRHIQRLQFRMDKYFQDSVKYLIQRLESNPKTDISESDTNSDDIVFYKIKLPFQYRLFIDDSEYKLSNSINELVKIPLKKGDYLIKICSVPDNNTILEEVINLTQDKLYYKS